MRRGTKSVVRVAQRVAAVVPVQGLSSLLSNMYCLFDSSSTFKSDSLSKIVAAGQLITRFSRMHGQSVLICSAETDLMHAGFW